MPNITEIFPSEFLKADDLGGFEAAKRVTVTISDIKLWEDSQGERKINIGFAESRKRMLVNKTNARQIAKAYGGNTDNWTGKKIILYVAMVQFMDEMVPALRIMIPSPANPNAKTGISGSMVVPQKEVVVNPAPPVDQVDAFGLSAENSTLPDDDGVPF